MNKQAFLDTLRTGRAQWEALLAEIGEARTTIHNAIGPWSVKDVIANQSYLHYQLHVASIRAWLDALVEQG